MEAQRREAASQESARAEIALGVGAVDRAALPPQAARRFGGVVVAAAARGRRSRQGEEGARLVERRAQRRRAGAVADEVEEIAVLAGRGVGPLAGEAGTAEADEERPPAGAVEISRHPVAAVLAAVREIAPADGFGVGAERGGDAGGGRRIVQHAGPPSDPCGTPDTGRPPLWAAQEGRRAAHRACAAPERVSLGIGCRKKAGTEVPAKVGREETKR